MPPQHSWRQKEKEKKAQWLLRLTWHFVRSSLCLLFGVGSCRKTNNNYKKKKNRKNKGNGNARDRCKKRSVNRESQKKKKRKKKDKAGKSCRASQYEQRWVRLRRLTRVECLRGALWRPSSHIHTPWRNTPFLRKVRTRTHIYTHTHEKESKRAFLFFPYFFFPAFSGCAPPHSIRLCIVPRLSPVRRVPAGCGSCCADAGVWDTLLSVVLSKETNNGETTGETD